MNSLAVMAAQAAVADTSYIENYVAEVLAARELLCVGLEKLGITYVPSSANFVLGHFGKRALEVRDAPARTGHPGARPQLRSARLRPHHRGHARPNPPPAGSAGRNLEPMTQPLIVFDMDGVLVDVTESYRETIAQTVKHFTGIDVTREQIQDYKNQGGWNDDWKLTHHIITAAGTEIPFETARDYFQSIFLGNGERRPHPPRANGWRGPACSKSSTAQFQFAVFTGRPKAEAELTLNRFAGGVVFHPVIGMDDVEHHKPHPEGLLRILEANPGRKIYYIGDTVDDARCARAAEVPFIGIAAPSNPRYIDLVFLFQEEGAYAIVDDINFLQEVFAA